MGQKPPAWTRFDQVGQVPLMLSRNVQGSGQSNTLAEQLVRRHQVAIDRFIANQRQQIELGEKDVHSARLPLDGMDVHYTHVQGLERMHYNIRPERLREEPNFLTIPQPAGLAVEFFDGEN